MKALLAFYTKGSIRFSFSRYEYNDNKAHWDGLDFFAPFWKNPKKNKKNDLTELKKVQNFFGKNRYSKNH